jgi:hypothetical protein
MTLLSLPYFLTCLQKKGVPILQALTREKTSPKERITTIATEASMIRATTHGLRCP